MIRPDIAFLVRVNLFSLAALLGLYAGAWWAL